MFPVLLAREIGQFRLFRYLLPQRAPRSPLTLSVTSKELIPWFWSGTQKLSKCPLFQVLSFPSRTAAIEGVKKKTFRHRGWEVSPSLSQASEVFWLWGPEVWVKPAGNLLPGVAEGPWCWGAVFGRLPTRCWVELQRVVSLQQKKHVRSVYHLYYGHQGYIHHCRLSGRIL